jgi:hypothetical protein
LGAGTSAYQVLVSSTWLILHRPRISISWERQVEGAAAEDGRKPSIWDTFTHQGPSSTDHAPLAASFVELALQQFVQEPLSGW